MGLEEVRQRVKSKLPGREKGLVDGPLPDAAITQIFAEIEAEGRLPSDDDLYRRVIERVRKLEFAELPVGPTDRLLGKALARALAPKIEVFRRKGFDRLDPPFETVTEVAEWVERTSEADLAEWRQDSEERKKARAEIERLAGKHRIEFVEKFTQIPFQKPGEEHVRWVHAVPGTYLHHLAEETAKMAAQCGIPQAALVTHVLAGNPPVRSRARLTTRENWYTLPSGELIGVNEATVTFYARDLTDKEIRLVYDEVRGHVGGKGTKGMKDKDEYLWELVQDRGGPPREHGGKGRFWEDLRKCLNREYPDEPFTTWNGVKRRYERISTRLRLPQ